MKASKTLFLVFFTLFSIGLLMMTPTADAATQESEQKQLLVYLDNYPLLFPVEPRIEEAADGTGHTVVPFRKLAESIGVDVAWDSDTQTIIANGAGKQVLLTLSQHEAHVDSEAYPLAIAPFVDQGHTLIPLRFFSEVFGAKVGWDSESNTVKITSPARDMYTFSFYGLGSFEHRHYVPQFDGMAYTWSRINQDGEWTMSSANQNEYFWPEPHPDASTEDIIRSGQDTGGEAFLMVAAFEERGEVSAMLLDEEKTKAAIEGMVERAVQKEMEGIFIDFEGIRNTEEHEGLKIAFTQFVEELTKVAKSNGLLVGVAVTPTNNFYNGYEYQS